MSKEDVVCAYTHTQWNTTQALKKNKIIPFAATLMQPEKNILSQSERERQILYDVTYMWNLNSKCASITRQNHRYREQTGVCQRGVQ